MPEPRVHEVWFAPGWPEQKRCYRGPDEQTAALSFATAGHSMSKDHHEVVWTVDGVTHQKIKFSGS